MDGKEQERQETGEGLSVGKQREPSRENPRFSETELSFEAQSLSSCYRAFRKSGLGRIDSLFNAVYIRLSERSVEKLRENEKKNPSDPQTRPMELHSPALQAISRVLVMFRGFLKRHSHPSHKEARVGGSRFWPRLRRVAPMLFLLALIGAAGIYVFTTLSSPIVVRAEIHGKSFAIVENRSVVDQALRELEQSSRIILGTNFQFPHEISYSLCRKGSEKLTEKSKIYEELLSCVSDFICTGAGVYVDDVLVAVLETETQVQETLDRFVESHKTDELIGIYNDIRVVTQLYPARALSEPDRFLLLLEEMLKPFDQRQPASDSPLLPGAPSEDEQETIPDHVLITDVKIEGETNISTSHYPQSIRQLKISFYSAREFSYEAEVPYRTVYQEDSQYYTSMISTLTQGKNGRASYTAKVYYIDGKETKREIQSISMLEEPVDCVVSIGTRMLPEDLGITSFDDPQGRFIVPKLGWVSSYFGPRDGGYHYGWDIPGRRGDNLYAAASGTVLVAIGQDGYFNNNVGHSYSGYGYCVVIQHDDGYSTLYAHCSKILVTLGQKVKQGDKIAEVGSTGDSDGNHVHFEIVYNNYRKLDPARYLYQGNTTIYDKP